jgi:serine/threonine protein phosphatase PrpC
LTISSFAGTSTGSFRTLNQDAIVCDMFGDIFIAGVCDGHGMLGTNSIMELMMIYVVC